MDQLQKMADIIDSLMDELSRGWINYCVARHLHEAYASKRITGARWLVLACYQSCLESSVLALSRLLIPDQNSIHIAYLLNCAESCSKSWPNASRAKVLGSVAASRVELETVRPQLTHVKHERDWVIAHLDRHLITQPEMILSRPGVNMEDVGQAYQLVLRIVNTYAGYLSGSELNLDNVEYAISSDLDYVIELMERDQGITEKQSGG